MYRAVTYIMLIALSCSNRITMADRDTYISIQAQESCIRYGKEYGFCPELLMAMVEKESSGKPTARNGDCIGLMQVSERWHRDRMDRLGVEDLWDEDDNIHVAVDYLAELRDEYGEEMAYLLDIYNGNSKAKSNYDNGILSGYSRRILARAEELERVHGK